MNSLQPPRGSHQQITTWAVFQNVSKKHWESSAQTKRDPCVAANLGSALTKKTLSRSPPWVAQSHWWVIWSYSALKRWGNSGCCWLEYIYIYNPFSISYFSIFKSNPGPFSVVMWLFTRGVTKWLWYMVLEVLNRLLLLQHVGVIF